MMKRKTLKAEQVEKIVKEEKSRETGVDKSNGTAVDDDDSDEDMFGGLDD